MKRILLCLILIGVLAGIVYAQGSAILPYISIFIRTLLDDADQGTARTTLGVGTGDSPAFTGVTVTGDAVLGLNSSVFQPAADSTTFFQILDADGGRPIFNVDSTNERIGFGESSPETFIEITDATSYITLHNNTKEDTDGRISQINFKGEQSGGQESTLSRIKVYHSGYFGNNQHGMMEFFTNRGSDNDSPQLSMVLNNGCVGFNVQPTQKFVYQSSGGTGVLFKDTNDWCTLWIEGQLQAALSLHQTGGTSGRRHYQWDSTSDKIILRLLTDSGTQVIRNILISDYLGQLGIGGETDPETLTEWTHATPYLTLHNDTHEDTAGSRESRIIAKGEQSGGEETTLGYQEFGHDGALDDEKGYWKLYTNDGNDGAAPTIALTVDSSQNTTFSKFDQWSVTAGITAVTPGVQGDGALTTTVNEISVCANANDAVTLPAAVAGRHVVIINNGANTLEIWPASGDNAGAGVDTAVTLASGSNVHYVTYDTTNWESI